MGQCIARCFKSFRANPENPDGYVLAQNENVLGIKREYDAYDPDSLPAAVQVVYKDLTIRTSPEYPGTKCEFAAPLGSFWKPRAKHSVNIPSCARPLTFFEIEYPVGASTRRG